MSRESLTESMRRLSNIVTEAEQLDENPFKLLGRGVKALKGRQTKRAADTVVDTILAPILSKPLREFDYVLDLDTVQLKQVESPKNQLLQGQDYKFTIDARPEALQDYPYRGDTTHKGLIDQAVPRKLQNALRNAMNQWATTEEGKKLSQYIAEPKVDFSYAANGKYQAFSVNFTVGDWDSDI